MSRKDKLKQVEDTMQLLNLNKCGDTIIGDNRVRGVSGGERKRVNIASELLTDPSVILLDEPTSGLDPNQIIEIREVIKNLGQNKTVLFSSHILQEVEAICDRVIIINKGNIVADDKLVNLQKSTSGSHLVIVSFKEQVNINSLKNLAGVTKVDEQQPGVYQLHTLDPDGVRKQLLELSLKNNLNIVSLQSESNSLEEVFRNLTSNN
jgi:ABC-2 type transport system ATP-binding protein